MQHINEAIASIDQYTQGGREDFFSRKLVQDAVLRNLEIIGEAVKHLSPEFRTQYPNIPWKQIAGLRDVLIHQYFGIDLDMIWLVIEKRLPTLTEFIHNSR